MKRAASVTFGRRRGAREGRLARPPAFPEVAVVERFGSDEDGLPLVRPIAWPRPGEAPVMRLVEAGDSLPIGGRAAARLRRTEDGEFEARILRRLDRDRERVVGLFRHGRGGPEVVPADRRNRTLYRVLPGEANGAREDDLVIAETLPARRQGPAQVRIVERLGPASEPHAASLIAIAENDIPTEFPTAALSEAAAAMPVDVKGRADLRDVPLVTIDGADARDFDDAVWAEPDPDPDNRGGWHILVAIADVAWYVRPGSALDREAQNRGNSVYFPDRVVPMLPPALSNELCSLKPNADRACLAAHLWIDAAGRKRRHRFERALMRSQARLTYEEVERARHATGAPTQRLRPLYAAWAALDEARRRRGAIDLDLPEYRVLLDGNGRPASIEPRRRLDSHRLIEEFMILANVAAAEELERLGRPCMYRVHDAPDPAKLAALSEFLDDLGLPGLGVAKGQAPKPAVFNRILARAAATPVAALVNELVLRAQAQALYSPANIGHFGLALRRYAHFTSPIRRYADLLVHRALLGEPPLAAAQDFAEIGAHISATERRAVAAERAALDRYRAAFLAAAVGQVFAARITGIAEFGMFVSLAGVGADGLVPISSLGDDYYRRDERGHSLVGRRSRRAFTIGDAVSVRLLEADALSARLVLALEESGSGGAARRGRRPRYR
ncbi:MAG TPA: ribonuclease R [Stellaceae bacterium]|nr:ribonuclease R [Stellaceae bacterium]